MVVGAAVEAMDPAENLARECEDRSEVPSAAFHPDPDSKKKQS